MKRILALAALVLLISTMAFAQTTASGNATVSATVMAALRMTVTDNAIDFGSLYQGTTGTVSPITGGASAAAFTVTGQVSTNVTVSYSDVTLAGPGPSLTMTASVSTLDANTQASSTAIASGATASLGVGGTRYFWAGGSVVVPNAVGQTAGTYSGTFTLSVAY